MSDLLRRYLQYVAFVILGILLVLPLVVAVAGVVLEGWARFPEALAIVLVLTLLALSAPRIIMTLANPVVEKGPYAVSGEARALHNKLDVCDLHADTFLWARNPLVRSRAGHIDLPRLEAGGAALQVFAAATSCPIGMNFSSTPRSWDMLTPMLMLQGWPMRTWGNLHERARYMAQRMDRMAQQSNGRFVMIRWKEDLEHLLARRHAGEQVIGGLASIEGAHCLEGRLEHLDTLFDAGYRMMGLNHFFDNETSGSAHGVRKGGLTGLGRTVIERMESLGMVVDLTHASERSIEETLGMATRPLVISHTGPYGMHPSARNVRDEHLQAVAATGGVVGIGFWKDAVGRPGSDAVVDGLCYALDLLGADHVTLGSDWDGFTPSAIDAAGLPLLTGKLLARGLSEAVIAKVMGANILRLLTQTLPARSQSADLVT